MASNEPFFISKLCFRLIVKWLLMNLFSIKKRIHPDCQIAFHKLYKGIILHWLVSRQHTPISKWSSYVFWYLFEEIPVMAAVAVRKKVISTGDFSPCFYLQSLNFFYLSDQIKSNCLHWLYWKSESNRTEPNELDELKYSK